MKRAPALLLLVAHAAFCVATVAHASCPHHGLAAMPHAATSASGGHGVSHHGPSQGSHSHDGGGPCRCVGPCSGAHVASVPSTVTAPRAVERAPARGAVSTPTRGGQLTTVHHPQLPNPPPAPTLA